MRKYKEEDFLFWGKKNAVVELASCAHFRKVLLTKQQKIRFISEPGPSEPLQPEVLGFIDLLNDDLSLPLCSTDVL